MSFFSFGFNEISISYLILFILSTIGMTHLLVEGAIFKKLRGFINKKFPKWFKYLISCYQCTGTWCGMLCGSFLIDFNLYIILLCGCAGSILSLYSANIISYIEAQTLNSVFEEEEENEDTK